jgi:hypothetical protein
MTTAVRTSNPIIYKAKLYNSYFRNSVPTSQETLCA